MKKQLQIISIYTSRLLPLIIFMISGLGNAQERITLNVDDFFTGNGLSHYTWDLKLNVKPGRNIPAANLYYRDTEADIVRFPIYAPAHNEDGTINMDRYSKELDALRNIMRVKPSVKIFASLKLDGADTYPAWIESNQNGRIFGNTVKRPRPDKYAELLYGFLQMLKEEDPSFTVEYLGLINETEGTMEPGRYVNTINKLRNLLDENPDDGIPEPQFIAPEAWNVYRGNDWLDEFIAQGRNKDYIQLVGNHFYNNKGTIADWEKFSAFGKPVWYTECDIQSKPLDGKPFIYRTRYGLARAFTSIMGGAINIMEWSGINYDNIAGRLTHTIASEMMGYRPIKSSYSWRVHKGNNANIGVFDEQLVQAFRKGDSIKLWLVNVKGQEATWDFQMGGNYFKNVSSREFNSPELSSQYTIINGTATTIEDSSMMSVPVSPYSVTIVDFLVSENSLSLEQLEDREEIVIYPTVNVENKIHVSIPGVSTAQPFKVQLINMNGQVVEERQAVNNSEIPIHENPSGVYFVRVQYQDRNYLTKIIME